MTVPVVRRLRRSPITTAGGASATSSPLAIAAMPATVMPLPATDAITTPATIVRMSAAATRSSRLRSSAAYRVSISVAPIRTVPIARWRSPGRATPSKKKVVPSARSNIP